MQAQPTIYRRRIHASKETCQDRQAKRRQENELISKDMRSRREGGREGGKGMEGWRDGGHLANIISPHTQKFCSIKYNNTNYDVYI